MTRQATWNDDTHDRAARGDRDDHHGAGLRPASPGKRTLTMGLPPRAPGSPAAQRKPRDGGDPRPRQYAGPVEDWTDVVFRPDLHQQPILRKSAGQVGISAAPPTSAGKPMPEAVQAKMERAFGTDFSAVRIHEGPQAESVGALAYAQGTDIHFAPGQYQPESRRGQELLGHELAHVGQQAQGKVQATAQAKGVAINDDPALERAADEMGARAARGEPTGLGVARSTPTGTGALVQRKLQDGSGADLSVEEVNALKSTYPSQAAEIQSKYASETIYIVTTTRQGVKMSEPVKRARPFNLKGRAQEDSPWTSLMAVTEKEHENENPEPDPKHAKSSGFFTTDRANPEKRKDAGTVVAKSLGMPRRVTANELAEKIDPSTKGDGNPREHTHLRGRGLGGDDSAGNLGVASKSANTEMAVIESTVAGEKDVQVNVTFYYQGDDKILVSQIKMEIINTKTNEQIHTQEINAQKKYFTKSQFTKLKSDVKNKIAQSKQAAAAEALLSLYNA